MSQRAPKQIKADKSRPWPPGECWGPAVAAAGRAVQGSGSCPELESWKRWSESASAVPPAPVHSSCCVGQPCSRYRADLDALRRGEMVTSFMAVELA